MTSVNLQLTAWSGARHGNGGGGNRAGISKGSHLWTKIEFGTGGFGAHADGLLMRLTAAQHNVNLLSVKNTKETTIATITKPCK